MKKKVLLTGIALAMLASTSAYAEFNVDVNLGVPVAPVYVAPAPAIIVNPAYPGYYDPHHRRGDWRYWQNHRGHDERHDHDEHWHR